MEPIFGRIFAKIWRNGLKSVLRPKSEIRIDSYLRNLVLEQLQKQSWKNINCSRSYKILSDGHVGKNPN